MLKHTVARLLLFAIGLLLSYFLTHPAPAPVQEFILCGDQDGDGRILIVRDPADCTDRLSPRRRTSEPGSIHPANSGEIRGDGLDDAGIEKQVRTF